MVRRDTKRDKLAEAIAKLPSRNFIAEWRRYRGIATQTELAALTGITRATICRLENGTLPWRQRQLEPIALALGCQPHDLIATNPVEMASILQIYNAIPENRRVHALKVMQSFADANGKTKRKR